MKLSASLFLFSALTAVLAVAGMGRVHAAAPQLKASATQHQTTLSWGQGVVDPKVTCPSGSGSTAVTANTIYKGTASGNEVLLTVLNPPPANLQFIDTNVTPGAAAFYTISATNCSGEGPKSNETSGVTPNPGPPGAPTQNPLVLQ